MICQPGSRHAGMIRMSLNRPIPVLERRLNISLLAGTNRNRDSPCAGRVKSIVLKHWNILKSDPNLWEFTTLPPCLCFQTCAESSRFQYPQNAATQEVTHGSQACPMVITSVATVYIVTIRPIQTFFKTRENTKCKASLIVAPQMSYTWTNHTGHYDGAGGDSYRFKGS
jgi:hypothetical protein